MASKTSRDGQRSAKKRSTRSEVHAPRHGPTHWEDVLRREFEGESDRASVILGAAVLDSALETLLRSVFVPASSADDPLFDGANAPLATFSARIEIAYRLSLIDAAFAKNLHLVRKIRNDFAHNVTGCTFGDTSVVNRLTELRRSTGLPDKAPDLRPAFPDGPRGDFQFIISWLQWMLRSLTEDIEPISRETTLSGCYDFMAEVVQEDHAPGSIHRADEESSENGSGPASSTNLPNGKQERSRALPRAT